MKTLYTLGTVQLGMPYGISNRSGQPSREIARQMLDTAYDLGVRALDTASDYGTSEEILGNERAPDKFHITSKFSIGKRSPRSILQTVKADACTVENGSYRLLFIPQCIGNDSLCRYTRD